MPEPISAPAACTPPGDSPPVLGFVRSRSPRFRHSSASLSSGRSGSALAGNVRCCLHTRPCFRSSVSRRVPADTVLSGRDSAPLYSPERRGPCPWPGLPWLSVASKMANEHTHKALAVPIICPISVVLGRSTLWEVLLHLCSFSCSYTRSQRGATPIPGTAEAFS